MEICVLTICEFPAWKPRDTRHVKTAGTMLITGRDGNDQVNHTDKWLPPDVTEVPVK